jgi:uncharacterized protein (TIGR00266 family)
MQSQILGAPSFARLQLQIDPGETLFAESGSMSSMDASLSIKAQLNGSIVSAIVRRVLSGESFFINRFNNSTQAPLRLNLVAATPGDLTEVPIDGNAICLEPGALVAWTPGVRLSTRWAGLASWIRGTGLFKLIAHGKGKIWIGAYGAILFRDVHGEEIVDTDHIVAWEPQVQIKLGLAGGIFSSFFGGEGLVTRVKGPGKIALQTRSVKAMASWINPHLL